MMVIGTGNFCWIDMVVNVCFCVISANILAQLFYIFSDMNILS